LRGATPSTTPSSRRISIAPARCAATKRTSRFRMKATLDAKIEAGRIRSGHYASRPGTIWGAFMVMGPCGRRLQIICGDGREIGKLGGWEHVSVSIEGKHPPNWQEMSWVKDHFWDEEETVMQ